MKTFLVVVLSVTALYIWQRNGETSAVTENKPAVQKAAPPAPSPSAVSEHNWAKHSLDRAHAVVDQVQQSRRENGQP